MLSTDCRVRGPSPGHGVSSSESEGSSHKLIGGLQFLLFCRFYLSIHKYVIGTRWHLFLVGLFNKTFNVPPYI